jgi:hypothetical protein
MDRAKTIRARFIRAAMVLGAILACASIILAQKSKRTKPRPKAPAAAAPAMAPVPFRAGETLEYRVLFSKYAVNAAKIETSVVEERSFFGHPAWHFRAAAHTLDTTRMLFAIDDEFDSYTSAANLFSLQFEMYLHEQGKEQTSLYRMTTDADPAPKDVTALRVVPGTRDAIGFLYALRAADWHVVPELKAPVFDGRRLYDAVARIDTPQGTVSVPAGNFPAFRVAIRLFDHGKEIADTHLWLWIATDAAHTPVLVEAEIPFGTCRIELLHLP